MENYIVSARKYRPAIFDSVVGQKALTTTLKNAIADHKLAHAYLFCGPRGVGKTTCARIFAKTINCMHPTPEGEACNHCESCVAFNEQRSYTIHELDAASNNSVDDIRQLVEQVRIPPQVGNYKVYIIDEVHMLSSNAFNAFLKTLEEPPRHAIFILATTEKHKILPTILSRCQIYDFNRITLEDIVAHLAYVASKEGISFEPEALNVIALKADGGMRDALSIFDQVASFTAGNVTYQSVLENLNVLDYEYYFRLTDSLLANRVSDALLLFNEVLNKGFDGNHFITGLASHFRDLMVCKDDVTVSLLEVGASIRDRYLKQAEKCQLPFLYQAIKICNDADLNYRLSKNRRLLVELALIQLAQLTSEGSDLVGGRSPKQVLNPIFSQSAGNNSQVISAQPVVVQQPVKVSSFSTTAVSPASSSEVASVSKAVRVSSTGVEQKIPVIQLSKLGVSIKKTHREHEQAVAETPSLTPSVAYPMDDVVFNEDDLLHYWKQYASQLPIERTALAKRMQGIHPTLMKDGVTFEILVDNEFAAKDFQALSQELEEFLRTSLRNSKVSMKVRVSEIDEVIRPVGRVERFQMMMKKNNALVQFREEFGLELY